MDNPITPAPVKPFIDYKQRDLDLYNKWKQTGDKRALADLITSLHPIIYSEVKRGGTSLPEAALSAEAKKWAVRALQTYDPTRGVAVSTHVVNYLPKVRRLNYKYRGAARLPENQQLEYSNFQNAISHLETTLNREPTDDEIAAQIGWTKGQVMKFKNLVYTEQIESANQRATEFTQFDENKLLMQHILDNLDEQEKTLLLNKGTMPAAELAAKLGVNVSRLNYLSAKLRDKIMKMKKEINFY